MQRIHISFGILQTRPLEVDAASTTTSFKLLTELKLFLFKSVYEYQIGRRPSVVIWILHLSTIDHTIYPKNHIELY